MARLELDDMALGLLNVNNGSDDTEQRESSTEEEASTESTNTVSKEESSKPEPSTVRKTNSTNVMSAFAERLKDKGIFNDDLDISSITNEDDLLVAINNVIDSRIGNRQRALEDALQGGMQPTEIQQYEATLNELNGIDDAALKDVTDNGFALRRYLIYNDLITKGFTKERAEKQTDLLMNSDDAEGEAREALESLKKHFSNSYSSKLQEASNAKKAYEQQLSKESEALHNSILKDSILDGVEVSDMVRKKVWDTIAKPTIKDKEGNVYTELQNYERNNRKDFLKNVGFLYVITDGFKNIDTLVKSKVNDKYNKKISNFENMLRTGEGTSAQGGNLNYMTESEGSMSLEKLKALVEGTNR